MTERTGHAGHGAGQENTNVLYLYHWRHVHFYILISNWGNVSLLNADFSDIQGVIPLLLLVTRDANSGVGPHR
jgi:hypothetical protein